MNSIVQVVTLPMVFGHKTWYSKFRGNTVGNVYVIPSILPSHLHLLLISSFARRRGCQLTCHHQGISLMSHSVRLCRGHRPKDTLTWSGCRSSIASANIWIRPFRSSSRLPWPQGGLDKFDDDRFPRKGA